MFVHLGWMKSFTRIESSIKCNKMSDITVSSSSIINGPAEKVWKTLSAFGGIESFNPLVTSSELEGLS